MAGTASIVIRGDVRQAMAVLDALGVKAEEVGKRTETAFGSAATSTGNIFQKLGQAAGNWGVPFSSSLSKMGDKLAETETKGQKAFQALSTVGGATLLAVGAGAIAAGVEAVKMAGNFQSASEHLVTDAGESQSALKGVENGMLAISAATGTSSADIVNGMYHIESAGQHGAAGLAILKAAAEGAKVGNADLDTVSKTLVGTMNSFHMPASQATSMMNQLIATVGSGDMRMEDLASSLGNVTPLAAKAGLSFAQVGGAIATMTSQNMSAQQATQDLNHLIAQLQGAVSSPTMSKAMAQMGLNANTVSQQLGQKGLTGTLNELASAVTEHMGPAGQVVQQSFNQAVAASQDMITELAAMPAAAKKVAEQFANGQINVMQYRQEVKAMPADQQAMLQGFLSTYNAVHSFNNQLKSGSEPFATFNSQMSAMLGGQTSLTTALMLTGTNAATFSKNVATIGEAAHKTGANVDNWSSIQKTFNQQIDQAKVTVEDLGIRFGMFLIPKLQEAAKDTAEVVNWFEKHKAVAEALGYTIVSVLGAAVAAFTVNKLAQMTKGIIDAGKAVGGLISKMTGLGGSGVDSTGKQAAASLDTSAGNLQKAAQALTAAAEKLSTAGQTAASDIEGAATTASGELKTGAGEAAAEIDAAGATAAGEEAAGGATGIAGGAAAVGKGAGAAGALDTLGAPAAGAAGIYGLAYLALKAGGQQEQADLSKMTPQQLAQYASLVAGGVKIQPSAFLKNQKLPPNPRAEVMYPGPVHRAMGGGIAAGQLAIVGENGPELAQFNVPATIYPNMGSIARTVAAVTGGSPGSGSITASEAGMLAKLAGPTYNIETLQVVANDPAQFEAQVQQRARVGNLAGGSMRSRAS